MQKLLVCGLLVLGLTFSITGEDKQEHAPKGSSNQALEKMKTLVGTWVNLDQDGKPTAEIASVIRLTAGGTAIQETLFPGQPHEMVSMYTVDGGDLIMTHYCMLGNQPRMKASPKSTGNKLIFEFVGGSNLDPKKDKHMHSAVLTIVDADHIEVDGTGWENGAPAKEMCGGMKLVRKK